MTDVAAVTRLTTNREHPRQIASWAHMWGLIGIIGALAIAGAMMQRHANGHVTVSRTAVYISLILFEYGLLRYVRHGIARHGLSLRDLIGGSWNSPGAALRDVALAAGLYAVWTGIMLSWAHFSGLGESSSVVSLPATLLERSLWVGVSVCAGFVEEVVFRGYLQRQFGALTSSRSLGVLLQAVIFGIGHSYEGTRAALQIVLFGLLFGAFAAWRRSLRACVVAHALADILAGLAGL